LRAWLRWIPLGLLAWCVTRSSLAVADSSVPVNEREHRPGSLMPASAPDPAPPASADAAEPTRCQPATCISGARRAAAIAAAVVPGLLLHGAGSWVAGRPLTARRLATSEAVGIAMIVAGGLPILATYGSPKVVFPGVPIVVSGVGVFLGGWIGDIWAASGASSLAGQARAESPRVIDAGVSWMRDPYRGDRALLELGAGWRWRGWGLAPRARIDVQGQYGEGGFDASWHLLGRAAQSRVIAAGHRLFGRLGAFARFDRGDDLTAFWNEAEIGGRFDMRAIDAALAGMFFEASAGLALEVTRYSSAVYDVGSTLLARYAVGAYLGHGRGELSISYDHRRDDLVGGFFAGRAAGFFGHLGAHLQLRTGPRTALLLGVELGTALLSTITLRYDGP
jgi:hypothetical protein